MARTRKKAEPGIGHNSEAEVGGIAADRLRSLIERIERLTEEPAAVEEHRHLVALYGRALGMEAGDDL